jgi:hypothetical protein
LTKISTHAPNEEKDEIAKEELYSYLEKACGAVHNYNMKTVLGDYKDKAGKESYFYPACGGHSLHNKTNHNGEQMVNFAMERDLSVTGTWYQYKDIHNIT